MLKKITFLVFALVATLGLQAQIYYITTTASGNPGNLNTDPESPVGSGLPSNWTTILTPNNSSPTWSATQTVPFVFNYNGSPETQFKVSSSGVLTFDAASSMSAPSHTNASIPSALIPNKSILIWGLRGTGSNDNISTKVFGTAPNRQLWVFFSSYSFANSGNNGYAYFSIVLEETTNHMYIVDQRRSGNLSLTIGTQVSGSVAYSVPGSPNVAGLAGTNSNSSDNFFYSIYPGPQPTIDAAGQQILLASPIALNQAPYTLQAKFGNYGTTLLTSATINYRINGGATVSSPLTGLNMVGNTSTTLTHPTVWNPGLGTYTVEMWLSNPNGTADLIPSNDKVTKEIEVSNNVSIDDFSTRSTISLYPNPTHDKTTLLIESISAEKAQLAIVSLTGQVVIEFKAQLQSGKNELVLPTADLTAGLYLVRITLGIDTKILKLNKQ